VTTPAVSVLMGVWNGAPRVREAIESVLAQTMGDLELVVIDDGSTDATASILGSFDDARVRVTRQPRGGLTSALRSALDLARAPAAPGASRRRRRRGVRAPGASA